MRTVVVILLMVITAYCIVSCHSTSVMEDVNMLSEKKCELSRANHNYESASHNMHDTDMIKVSMGYIQNLNDDISKTMTKFGKKYDDKTLNELYRQVDMITARCK